MNKHNTYKYKMFVANARPTLCLLPLFVWGVLSLLCACSTTAHLPEGEVLYTGIEDINFGDKVKKRKNSKDSTGVITAFDDAYESIKRVIAGESIERELTLDMESLTKEERDSLKRNIALQDEVTSVTREEVEAVLSIAPNNSLLGSAKYRFPLPIGLWTYNRFVGSKSRFGKWMFNSFAATPKLISTVNPGLRAKVAQNVLHNYGFFRGEVSYEVIPSKNPRKAKVAYDINARQLYRLDSIHFQYFPPIVDSLIHASMRNTLLQRGAPFTAANLAAERERLNTLLRNNGYYFCQPSFFTYRADTLQRQNWVQLQVRPSLELPRTVGRRYALRYTRFHIIDGRRGLVETDSLMEQDLKVLYAADGDNHKPSVKPYLLKQQIRLRKGSLYRQRLSDMVQDRIKNLGIFSQVSMRYTPVSHDELGRRDSLMAARGRQKTDSLDLDIYAVLDKAYDAEFKANATTKSNGLIGPGLSFSMTKRNAFRGCEALKFHAYGSYEWQTGSNQQGSSNLFNSYEYGTSLSLDYPYIKFGRLGRRLSEGNMNATGGRRNLVTSSTSYKLEADWLNRAGYFGRVSFGAAVVINYQRRRTIKHELTPFRLDYDVQLHSTAAFDSLMNENQALSVSMRNQFVPSAQYVLSMTSRRQARNPRTFTLTVKEAGNVFSGLYACFGQKFNEQNKNLFGVPFAQYLKATAEFTEKYKIGSTKAYLAGRVLLGSVISYGNSIIAPYSDLFTIGGANSIRAFSVRSIGPGSYHPADSKYSYVNQMGDLKFEANVECRFPIVGNLNGAAFLDCGNVWLMKNNQDHPGGSFNIKSFGRELALGTGFGLRYDLDFIVVRFDVGIGIHAPYDTGKSGYYNMTKFGKSLGYHLAIGYPF